MLRFNLKKKNKAHVTFTLSDAFIISMYVTSLGN